MIRGMAHGALGVLGGVQVLDQSTVHIAGHGELKLALASGVVVGFMRVLNFLDDNPLPKFAGLTDPDVHVAPTPTP
jgi:hypothetical protein